MSPSHAFNEVPDWDAIARYRAGESASDEAAAVSSWLEHHPNDAHLLKELDAAIAPHLEPTPISPEPIDVEAALQRVHRRLTPDAGAVRPPLTVSRATAPARSRPLRVQLLVGLAAAAAIALVMVQPGGDETSRVGFGSALRGMQPGDEFSTGFGARDSVVLSDGTRVLLAPSSRLIVGATYGQAGRDVTLEGMAHFAVQHDGASPFVVHASGAVIRDIGTAFVVRTGASSSESVSVSVSEGEVSLGSHASTQPPASLRAGDRGELRPDGNVIVQRGAASDADTAWTRGALVYRAAPLVLVREDVRRWFGIELRIADTALASRTLTATFDATDVEQVLRTIALALGAEVERVGEVATLRSAARPR